MTSDLLSTSNWERFIILWSCELLVLMSISLPICLFIKYGWEVRKQEFTNQLFSSSSDQSNAKLAMYFLRFWQGAIHVIPQLSSGKKPTLDTDRAKFDYLYDVMNAKKWYKPPAALLLITSFFCSGLVISTAIRLGHNFQHTVMINEGFVRSDYYSNDMPSGVLFPFSSIDLDLPAIAALGGAYLYIMSILLRGYRTRSLVSSDIWWCCVRLVLAIPLGFSLGQVASSNVGVFIVFALGAFPTYALIVLIRRLLNTSLNQSEERNQNDDLIKLTGVTPNIAALLADEGIESIQQLSSTDPISLALRSGLSASYLMYLTSQAQAWKLLGQYAQPVLEAGICDSTFIKNVLFNGVNDLTVTGKAIISTVAESKKLDVALLEEKLKLITNDDYTDFLSIFNAPHKTLGKSTA